MNDTDALISLRDCIEEWMQDANPPDFVHGFAAGLADKVEAQIWVGHDVVAEIHVPGCVVLVMRDGDGCA